MKNVERIIWFASIFFMIAILTLAHFQNKPVENTSDGVSDESNKTTEESAPYLRISVNGVKGFSASTDFEFKKGLSGDRLAILKNDENLSLEIKLGEQGETATDFAKQSGREIFQGPGRWQYYIDERWDSTPGTTTYENVKRVFFTEQDGVLVKAYQYDYTGGKYDKEIEEILSGVSFY